jgi:hypothetical protein
MYVHDADPKEALRAAKEQPYEVATHHPPYEPETPAEVTPSPA